ncbi:ArnT family glycosyltransferase [Peijinzhouia sedimentorum]
MIKLKEHNIQVGLVFLLSAIVLTINLGQSPFFLEEPRRALVAIEMLFSGNYWVPTIHGEIYLNKPPAFNWLLAIGFQIFGVHEWVPRGITVISFMIMAFVMHRIGRQYLDERTVFLATGLFLVSSDILFYFSFLGEIDLFFSLISFLSIILIFHYGEQKKFWLLFLSVYFLSAIGFLTKGLPSLLFPFFSLLGYFIWKKDFKRLLSIQHIAGILVLIIIVGGYFYQYNQYADASVFIKNLWSESSNRTKEVGGIGDFLQHFITFPFSFVLTMLPAGFMLLFLRKDSFSKIKAQPFLLFCLLMLLVNLPVYWISTGTRSRYLYMFYPFATLVLTSLYYQFPPTHSRIIWFKKVIYGLSWLILFLFLLALLPFVSIPKVFNLNGVLGFSIIIGLVFIVAQSKRRWSKIYLLILMLLVVRGVYGWVLTESRVVDSNAATDKAIAIEMAKQVGEEKLSILAPSKISFTVSYYLEQHLEEIVPYSDEIIVNQYMIAESSLLNEEVIEKINSFEYQGKTFLLFKAIED